MRKKLGQVLYHSDLWNHYLRHNKMQEAILSPVMITTSFCKIWLGPARNIINQDSLWLSMVSVFLGEQTKTSPFDPSSLRAKVTSLLKRFWKARNYHFANIYSTECKQTYTWRNSYNKINSNKINKFKSKNSIKEALHCKSIIKTAYIKVVRKG